MSFNKSRIFSPHTLLRTALPVICSIWLVWVFSEQFTNIDVANLKADVSAYGWKTWAVASVFTWISFAAVSGYDPIIGKALGLAIPQRRAASMSWKATAISQIVGFGLITGTLVRWLDLSANPHKTSQNTALTAFKLTFSVSIGFLASWAIVTAATASILFLSPLQILAAGSSVLLLVTCFKKIVRVMVQTTSAYHNDAIAFVALTLIDTLFAALVIYVFLPTGFVAFSTLYLAFLMSYTVGLVSGLPGGFGPFELCMILLLPNIDANGLAPALVGFRLTYFAVPAIAAAILIGLQFLRINSATTAKNSSFPAETKIPLRLWNCAPPERDLMSDSDLSCFVSAHGTEASLIHQTDRAIVQLGDSFGVSSASTRIMANLLEEAAWSKRSLSLYRCNRSTSAKAKKIGMRSLLFSSEAILRPAQFRLDVPSRSGLRRKLRQATKAGVTINSRSIDLRELSGIDTDWVSNHGLTRSFSTGKFSLESIKKQRIYVAYQNAAPVAFVTFSATNDRWLLDLIRYRSDCPNGAIYLLVSQAIEDARLCGVDGLSLGCVPFNPELECRRSVALIYAQIFKKASSLKGLYQFKKYFAPDWQDRFFVSSTSSGALVTTIIILRKIFNRSTARKYTSDS